MKSKSTGLVTPEQIANIVPADLAGMLNGVKQDFYDEYFGIQSFTLMFNFDESHNLILNLHHKEHGDGEEEEEALENASYSLYLFRRIAEKSPILFPFITEDHGDFGCSIGQENCLNDSGLSKLQKDTMVWELRKDFSMEDREWYIERRARCIQVYLTGKPDYDRVFSIAIPYSCPKRHYRSILKNLALWEQLKQAWDWPNHGAFGLFEKGLQVGL